MDTSLLTLRVFDVLARQLHYGRTADEVHLSQPSVTRHIRALETAVGTPLFARSSRTVQLTAAGRVLHTGVVAALDELDKAVEEALRAAQGRSGVIRLGFRGVWLVPAIVREQQLHLPDITLLLSEVPEQEQVDALCNDALDIIVTRLPAQRPGIICESVQSEPLALVVPQGHWATEHDAVRLTDLKDERLVLWRRSGYIHAYDLFMRECQLRGFTPQIDLHVDTPQTAMALVSANQGATILSYGYRVLRHEGVTFVPISDLYIGMHLSYRAKDADSTARFRELLLRILNSPT